MFKTISVCCGAEVGKGHQKEFPLGGSKYGISYEINVCMDCGKEADDLQDVYCCDYCGEVSQDKMMVNPEGDDLCDSCVMEALRNVIQAADRLIEKLEGDIIEACEYCGEPADQFIETRLGGICQTCIELDAEDLMELMARQGESA